ncbi:hypothetical protein O185_11595 [Photorhabdus temperata J3]|uniref:Uncharacterized protein n=1 Tax=Photorhabdus temperata J3 TaxID=1389415 RepID=U7QY13_PHOTE|nr:hypothetical protein O185_11595 [Photorhabdus temperata J3]
MDKTRQYELVRWLKQQSAPARRWLRLSMLFGLISGLLIITQAWLLASILQALIMDNIPRGTSWINSGCWRQPLLCGQ